MASLTSQTRTLEDLIENSDFTRDWNGLCVVSKEDLLRSIYVSFPEELERLKNVQAVETSTSPPPASQNYTTPSQILFQADFDEINRTLTGVLVLAWIYKDDYDEFVSGQPKDTKLSRESFEWLRKLFSDHIASRKDLFSLILSTVVNDLGKDPSLKKELKIDGQLFGNANHDTILLRAAEERKIPSLNKLGDLDRENIILGFNLGSELNIAQLAQAESPPNVLYSLSGLRDLSREHVFYMRFLEQILDVCGAAAHRDARGARTLTESVFQSYRRVYEVAVDVIGGNCTPRDGYKRMLSAKTEMLSLLGFRELSVENREDYALSRLLTMSRTSTLAQAELIDDAFHILKHDRTTDHFDRLVTGLNIGGTFNETAVVACYSPAMFVDALSVSKDWEDELRLRAIASVMRFLGITLDTSDEGNLLSKFKRSFSYSQHAHANMASSDLGWSIERDLSPALRTIASAEFKANPSILYQEAKPPGFLAPRRRTSSSLKAW